MADSPIGQNTTPTWLSTSPRPLNGTTFGKGSPRIPPSASPIFLKGWGGCPLEGIFLYLWVCHISHLSSDLHIIGFGVNPTCTRPSTLSEIFINLILFANNMAKSILDKIAKAAEARDKAIKEDAKKGMCAPCGEPSEDCMCDVFLDFVACE